jgi:dTDP-L-rhamnose 4-epimerase
MRLVITGGLGFIGSHFARSCSRKGIEAILLDNLSPQIHGPHAVADPGICSLPGVRVIRGSLLDRALVVDLMAGVDVVVHLASETGTGQSMYEVARYTEANVQGTAILLDAIRDKGTSVRKIVLASSRAVYGEGAYQCGTCTPNQTQFPVPRSREQLEARRWDPLCAQCGSPLIAIPTPEDARTRPASLYAATKFAQEEWLRIGAEALGIRAVILRLQNVYGEGQSLVNPYTGILSIFSTRVRQGKELPIFEDGLESRDFVHVSDVVEALHLAIGWERESWAIFNIGSGIPTSVLAVAQALVARMSGKVAPRITAQFRVGDIRHCFADLSHSRRNLGFAPKVSIDEGLSRFVEWVGAQTLPEDRLDAANAEMRRMKLMS